MAEISGKSNNEYPGLGLPLRSWNRQDHGFYPIGSHHECYGSESDIIPVRELAMMDVMEKLTDKFDWHKKVFDDDDVITKWRKEALAIPDDHFWQLAVGAKHQHWNHDDDRLELDNDWCDCKLENILDEDTFDACVQELRSKAKYFEQSGIIPSLDACASVAKSDTVVTSELHASLRKAFDKLKSDHAACPDWHPNSDSMVQDLVHPSMYPLVYGRSCGFREEHVGVTDAIGCWAGKGEIISHQPFTEHSDHNRFSHGIDSGIPPEYWSDTYQWLPANVAFQDDGSVKFTSYINNLHPTRYPEIYRTIEKLVETSILMWDQCLRLEVDYDKFEGAGRTDTRTGRPINPSDENEENWIPSNKEVCADLEVSEEELRRAGYRPGSYKMDAEALLEAKWETARKARMSPISFSDVSYTPQSGRRLADRYFDSGLQIIVKMASIELTPDKPEFPVGGCHIEGQMNENICATALYYLDSENVTENSLSFRMQTSSYLNDEAEYDVRQDCYHWMEQVYGTNLGCSGSPCLQNYGNVQTRQGRLLAFPNVFQHRVSPFQLIDPTKPGHRRFIALWLVDPTKRIISTANVPPQQTDWYVDSLLGSNGAARQEALSKLPTELINLLVEKGFASVSASREAQLSEELMDSVRKYFDDDKHLLSMSFEEANEHRKKLMRERSAFVQTSEKEWSEQTYNFLMRAACNGNTASTRSKWCDYSIDTDPTLEIPDIGVTRKYWLEPTDVAIAPDGISRAAMAINGSIPGPTLIADWADMVIVHVTNSLTTSNNGTSIYFHGLRAKQHGLTWYHSHFALQAWQGVFGGVVIDGPATKNYDENLGMLFLNDWDHQTVDELYMYAESEGPPVLDKGLINGTNTFGDGGHRYNVSSTSRTSCRIRLINAAAETHWRFMIDNHAMTVTASDLVSIEPYEANVVSIGMGQRYEMRAIPQSACAENDNEDDIRGIVYYDDSAGTPTTSGYDYEDSCSDETKNIVLYIPKTVGSTSPKADEPVSVNRNKENLFKWALNSTSMVVY
ncbi:hypothetical protein G6011_04310 [Alternaria panax]|uniref:Plastocyanin-like domain-containing protein n=1 Tax=Alternaria panax TaxID=48097 RepID=A0AAD4NUU5_9PLEO|nr:hypothetical protein G6011_04310 [Alternaria panax]